MGPPVGQAMEFLSQVLSQRGPDAVPYEESVKWTIREHMSELIKMFPTLSLSTNEFHANDGRIHNLLKAEGTIPIHFQGTKYNIPICVWLPERYPMTAPLAYVTPTPNMVIKQGHSFVNSSGLVRSPCISNWLFPSSDLSTMTQEMAMLFGTEPPLYSKPAGYTPPPVPQPGSLAAANGGLPGAYGPPGISGYNPMYPGPQQQQHGLYQQQPPGMGQYAGTGVGPASSMDPSAQMHPNSSPWAGSGAYAAGPQHQPPPQQQPQQQQQQPQQQQSPQRAEPPVQRQLQADFRALALGALASRLQTASEAHSKHAGAEMERLLGVQRQLVERDRELQRVVSAIQQERAGTEGIVAELGAKCAALDKWLEDNEWKVAATGADASPSTAGRTPLDVNKVIVAADALSRQALQAQVDDLAIEDALTVLDKALHGGQLASDAYLKQARLLCRRQFFARAKGLKVAAAQRQHLQQQQQQGQRQQQRQQPWQGGGAPGYPMTVGDAWMHGGTLPNPLGGAAAGH